MIGKKFLISLCLSLIFVGATQAKKSVFIISRHDSPSLAQAYSIEGNQVVYQAQVDIDTYNQGVGAVGNAIWPDKDLMFVTYEDSPMIVWASTKTLQKVGELDTGVSNLSGIAIDEEKEKIYTVKRDYDDLYIYSFDDVNNTVVLDNHYDLEVPSGWLSAWGLALDEENDLLYVSTSTKTVHVYDTTDWSHDHSIDIIVDDSNNRPAVGIAVDPTRGYMYTGAFHGTGGYHQYLVRTELSLPHNSIEVAVQGDYYNEEAIGLAVDDDTGYVYVTTDDDDFRVYDSNLNLLDTEENDGIYGPAGVAVGGWYKASLFTLVKDNNDPNDECVRPWNMIDENYLEYTICYDGDGNEANNVIIVDQLPVEVDYYSSDSNGDYDPNFRTVTWEIGNISGTDSNCVHLTVKVNKFARPGSALSEVQKKRVFFDIIHAANYNNLSCSVDNQTTHFRK